MNLCICPQLPLKHWSEMRDLSRLSVKSAEPTAKISSLRGSFAYPIGRTRRPICLYAHVRISSGPLTWAILYGKL